MSTRTSITRWGVSLAAVAVVALVAAGCGDDGDDGAGAGGEAAADDRATGSAGAGLGDLTGDLVGGGQLDANDLVGRDVVLWFWAPW